MTDNGIKEDGDLKAAPPKDAVAPNVAMSLHANGFIKVTFNVGILATTFFCDGQAARIIAGNFAEAADAYDEAWKQVAELAKASGEDSTEEEVVDDPDVLELFSKDEIEAHEAAVRLAEENGPESDLN